MRTTNSFVGAAVFAVAAGVLLPAGSAHAGDREPSAAEAQSLGRLYAQSIRDAAVKRPEFRKPLLPIDARQRTVTVATLTRGDPFATEAAPRAGAKGGARIERQASAAGRLRSATWVSLPSESQPACAGSLTPRLRLQQLLGMPPVTGPWKVVRFRVAPKHVFRPCGSGPSITTKACEFTLPDSFATPKERRETLATQSFVFGQMWNSYDEGFPSPGYPFTGMGWTYDWSPGSKDHYGVSEYVVKAGAPVTGIEVLTVGEYCASR